MRAGIVIAAGALLGCKEPAPPRHQQLAASLRTCRLISSGEVTCWGDRRLPARVADLDDAIAITSGLNTTCALRRGGAVACWGFDWNRRQPADRPVEVADLPAVVQVAAGQSHVCAVTAAGEVFCWGDNDRGQVGTSRAVVDDVVREPSRVEGIADAVEVSTGRDHTCVRHRDATVSCFGNLDLALGAGNPTPRRIDGLRDITALASGEGFVCGLTASAGEVHCAGSNQLGQLGSGDSEPHAAAVAVRGLTGIRAITASGWHGCALDQHGAVWCWGSEAGAAIMPLRNDDDDHGPVQIHGLDEVIDVAVADFHGCAARRDGSVWCWGDGRNGETARGPTLEPHAPARARLQAP